MLRIVCMISVKTVRDKSFSVTFVTCACSLYRLYLRIVLGSVNVSLLSKHDKFVACPWFYFSY